MAHSRGEVSRGCGTLPFLGLGSPLEPPFDPFTWSCISEWDLAVSGFAAPYQGRFIDRLKRLFVPVRATPLDLGAAVWQSTGPLDIVRFKHYPEDEATPTNVEQLLLALGAAREPIAFEVFGVGPSSRPGSGAARIETRFVASRTDLPLLQAQLQSLYPRSAVESHQVGFHESDHQFRKCLQSDPDGSDTFFVSPLCLETPYCFPIRTSERSAADPLATLVAVMERLGTNE